MKTQAQRKDQQGNMSGVTNPHDRFFREALSRPGAARAFLKHVLPADVMAVLDVSEPEMVQDSFVDAELGVHQADLLYRVQLRDGRGAYAYVLFEHKSTPDRWVAFQLLRYMVRIWERNLQERGKLWPIVPLVVYHGRDRWWPARTLEALLAVPEPVAVYTPNYHRRPPLDGGLEGQRCSLWLSPAGSLSHCHLARKTSLNLAKDANDRLPDVFERTTFWRVHKIAETPIPIGLELGTSVKKVLEIQRRHIQLPRLELGRQERNHVRQVSSTLTRSRQRVTIRPFPASRPGSSRTIPVDSD